MSALSPAMLHPCGMHAYRNAPSLAVYSQHINNYLGSRLPKAHNRSPPKRHRTEPLVPIMTRPLLISVGTRGDYEPLTALSIALSTSVETERVSYCVQPEFLSSVPHDRAKLDILPMPYAQDQMAEHFMCAFGKASMNATETEIAWSGLGLMMSNLIIPATDTVYRLARDAGCDVIVTTLGSWPIAHIVSKVLDIPMIMLSFQPDLSSRYFPHLNLRPKQCAASFVRMLGQGDGTPEEGNLETARSLHMLHFREYADAFGDMCARYGIERVGFEDVAKVFESTAEKLVTVIAVQPGIAPVPPDAPDNVHVIGSLAVDYVPDGYEPDQVVPELCRFLREGVAPVVISYGSLGTQVDGVCVTRVLMNGLRKADVKRAVILPGGADIGLHRLGGDGDDEGLLEWARDRVITVKGNAQFAWLLPQCEMLLCQGGAGCTGAALRAGIPMVVTPIAYDQMFFAEIVRQMGLGTVAGSQGLGSITVEDVVNGILQVRQPDLIDRVRRFSEVDKRNESAVERAVCIVNRVAKGQ